MDVISWAVGLIAGVAQHSLRRAVAAGALTSVAIRAYQHQLATPRQWGAEMPEDLFGATAMLLVTAAMAWVGSVIRLRRSTPRAEVAS